MNWDPPSRYVAAACEVLEANRRIARGEEVTLGRLGAGSSVVAAARGSGRAGRAQPRARGARRGLALRRTCRSSRRAPTAGALVGRVRVLRRYQLAVRPSSGRTGVLATAGGAPWLVRSGNVVLLGSRLDPAWTDLPVSAGFMPFMDALVNRLARGEVSLADGAPGDRCRCPTWSSDVRQGERDWRVEGGGSVPAGRAGGVLPARGRGHASARSARTSIRASRCSRRPATRRCGGCGRGRRWWRWPTLATRRSRSAARGDLRGPLLWAGARARAGRDGAREPLAAAAR